MGSGTHGCVPYGAIVLSNATYNRNAVPKLATCNLQLATYIINA